MAELDLTRAEWRKSSRSGTQGDCVEVAMVGDRVAVRDSRSVLGPVLVVSRAEWARFVVEVRRGGLDRPTIRRSR
ncbi:MAG TPA: DUF397 domain-containing protein [Micromonosporaceae bacterium]|nr:DUF397 domain-containing protein [Micromonosporaceae bacterium]